MANIEERKEEYLKQIKDREEFVKKPEITTAWNFYRYLQLRNLLWQILLVLSVFIYIFMGLVIVVVEESFGYFVFGILTVFMMILSVGILLEEPKNARAFKKAIEEYEKILIP